MVSGWLRDGVREILRTNKSLNGIRTIQSFYDIQKRERPQRVAPVL